MSPLLERLLLAASALACLHCDSGPPPEGTTGELGLGKFSYLCVEPGDSMCSDTFGEEDFVPSVRSLPKAVAVGSKFFLEFIGEVNKSGDGPSTQMLAASLGDQPSSEKFTIDSPRQAAFLAINSSDEVVDYIVVEAEEALDLRIEIEDEPTDQFNLAIGETATISAIPLNEKGDKLGGSLPYFWNANDSDVVSIEREHAIRAGNFSDGSNLRLTGQKSGREFITVSTGVLAAQIEIVVK